MAKNTWDTLAKDWNRYDFNSPGTRTELYMNSTNWLGISKLDNPFSKGNIAGGVKAMANTGLGKMGLGVIGGTVGGLAYNGISGGLSSGAGKAISGVTDTVGGALSNVNPLLGAAVQVGGGIIGGAVNALFGTGVDKLKLAEAQAGTNYLANFNSTATDFKEIEGPLAQANVRNAYSSGLFRPGWANSRNAKLRLERMEGDKKAYRAIDNNINNIMRNLIDTGLANYIAFGGPMYDPTGSSIGYQLATDKYVLDMDKINTENPINMFAGTPTNLFAFGGNTQVGGATYTDGLTHVNAGSSHELNPYGGVPMGADNQGTPNLVEEEELVYNDYVYSNRLTVPKLNINKKKKDEATQELKVLHKYEGMTYADAAKKAEKETGVDERPNDEIAKRGLEVILEILARSQEQQREILRLKELQEQINNMTPEEFALMQLQLEQLQAAELQAIEQLAQLDAMAQQEATMQLVPELQLISPEEAALILQQTILQLTQPMMAYGGNLYATGGEIAKHFNLSEDLWNNLSKEQQNDYTSRYYQEVPPELLPTNKESILTEDQSKVDGLTTNALDIEHNISVSPNYTLKSAEELKDSYQDALTRAEEMKKLKESNLNFEDQLDAANALYGEGFDEILLENGDYKHLSSPEAFYNYLTENVPTLDNTSTSLPRYLNLINNKDLFVPTAVVAGEPLNNSTAEVGYLPVATWQQPNTLNLSVPQFVPEISELGKENPQGEVIVDNQTTPINTVVPSEGPTAMPDSNDKDDDMAEIARWSLTREGQDTIKDIKNKKSLTNSDTNDFPKMQTWPYAAGLAMQTGALMNNILTPVDTSNADTLIKGAYDAGRWQPVTFNLDALYLRPYKFDKQFYSNQLGAQGAATRRAIVNNAAGNRGTAIAGLLAADANLNNQLGNLYRLAEEFQFNTDKAVAEHNNRINQIRALGVLEAARANQLAGLTASGRTLAGLQSGLAMKQDVLNRRNDSNNKALSGIANLIMSYGLNKRNDDLLSYYLKNTAAAYGGKLRKKRKGLI